MGDLGGGARGKEGGDGIGMGGGGRAIGSADLASRLFQDYLGGLQGSDKMLSWGT